MTQSGCWDKWKPYISSPRKREIGQRKKETPCQEGRISHLGGGAAWREGKRPRCREQEHLSGAKALGISLYDFFPSCIKSIHQCCACRRFQLYCLTAFSGRPKKCTCLKLQDDMIGDDMMCLQVFEELSYRRRRNSPSVAALEAWGVQTSPGNIFLGGGLHKYRQFWYFLIIQLWVQS